MIIVSSTLAETREFLSSEPRVTVSRKRINIKVNDRRIVNKALLSQSNINTFPIKETFSPRHWPGMSVNPPLRNAYDSMYRDPILEC